jgi:hypothetical protein
VTESLVLAERIVEMRTLNGVDSGSELILPSAVSFALELIVFLISCRIFIGLGSSFSKACWLKRRFSTP